MDDYKNDSYQKNDETKKNDFNLLLLMVAFLEAEGRKWDELRGLKDDFIPSRDEQYKIYFDKAFEKGVPSFQLDKRTTLYRARHIKSKNMPELGVDVSRLMDLFCKSILSDEDIQNIYSLNGENKDSFYKEHKDDLLLYPTKAERKKLGNIVIKKFDVTSSDEISISGLGFIGFNGNATIEIETFENVFVSKRKKMI